MITSSVFTRLGRHKPVKLRVLREFVDERNERGTDFHQSATGFHIRDIRKLRVRDIQQFRKLHAVGRSLIEHNNELGVCEHRSRGVALKQVVHVLRNTGTESAVFTNALPKSEQEVGAVESLLTSGATAKVTTTASPMQITPMIVLFFIS